jgi:hypothetical protein
MVSVVVMAVVVVMTVVVMTAVVAVMVLGDNTDARIHRVVVVVNNAGVGNAGVGGLVKVEA